MGELPKLQSRLRKQAATQTEDVGQSCVDPWVFMQAKSEVRVSADSEFHDSPRHP